LFISPFIYIVDWLFRMIVGAIIMTFVAAVFTVPAYLAFSWFGFDHNESRNFGIASAIFGALVWGVIIGDMPKYKNIRGRPL
jgi:hypothetical protein